jgi:hypothetical protein
MSPRNWANFAVAQATAGRCDLGNKKQVRTRAPLSRQMISPPYLNAQPLYRAIPLLDTPILSHARKR